MSTPFPFALIGGLLALAAPLPVGTAPGAAIRSGASAPLAAPAAATPGDRQGRDERMPVAPAPDPERTLAVDVVALQRGRQRPGRPRLFIDRDGWRYLFADGLDRQAFVADPERYEVQLGGACARMGPLSGTGSPDIRALWQGHLYLFASESCRRSFLEDPARLLLGDDPPVEGDAAALARGRQLLAQVLEALGGADRVDAVAVYRQGLEVHQQQDGQDVDSGERLILGFPGRVRVDEWSDCWRRTAVVTPDDDFFVQDGVIEMADAQRRALERAALGTVLGLVHRRDAPDFVAASTGVGTLDGAPVEWLGLSVPGVTVTLGVDPRSGRVLGLRRRGRGPDATVGTLQEAYGDFRRVGGLLLPATRTARFDGAPFPARSCTFTLLQVQTRPEPALFQRPRPRRVP